MISTEAPALNPVVLLEQLRWRYATKKFDLSRKIPAEIWSVLEEVLILTPSSFGPQPWKFYVVSDALTRMRLRQAAWDQPQIAQASHLVVFAYKKDLNASDVERYVNRISAVPGISPESIESYRAMMGAFVNQAGHGLDINAWAANQLYISLGSFLTSAALLGIDACPIEGMDPKQIDDILELPQKGTHAMFVVAAGYRSSLDATAELANVRHEASEVLEHL